MHRHPEFCFVIDLNPEGLVVKMDVGALSRDVEGVEQFPGHRYRASSLAGVNRRLW